MSHHASLEEIRGWFTGRLTEGWVTGVPEVTVDRDEILVVGELPDVAPTGYATDTERAAARASRVEVVREETRGARMAIADAAEERFRRKVAWGVRIGGEVHTFTMLAVPVMTRLRMRERAVLDTLIDAGVARSRSEALAWCVRLVADHQGEWIDKLREALGAVGSVREEGPSPAR